MGYNYNAIVKPVRNALGLQLGPALDFCHSVGGRRCIVQDEGELSLDRMVWPPQVPVSSTAKPIVFVARFPVVFLGGTCFHSFFFSNPFPPPAAERLGCQYGRVRLYGHSSLFERLGRNPRAQSSCRHTRG